MPSLAILSSIIDTIIGQKSFIRISPYISRIMPSLAVLSSIIDTITGRIAFIHISPYIRSQIFLLHSASIQLFLAACTAFKFTLCRWLLKLPMQVTNQSKPKCKLIWAVLRMILKCIFSTKSLRQAISGSHFSFSNVFSIASTTIKLWHSTVPLLTGLSAAVVLSACFNIQLFIHLPAAIIIKFPFIVIQKTIWELQNIISILKICYE